MRSSLEHVILSNFTYLHPRDVAESQNVYDIVSEIIRDKEAFEELILMVVESVSGQKSFQDTILDMLFPAYSRDARVASAERVGLMFNDTISAMVNREADRILSEFSANEDYLFESDEEVREICFK